MTIDELLALANLTANDEIPVWDAEATGEPTKKITAQQLAASIVALANLVTGIKGNAESTYRNGNVNLTPANIGAVTGDSLLTIKRTSNTGSMAVTITATRNEQLFLIIGGVSNTSNNRLALLVISAESNAVYETNIKGSPYNPTISNYTISLTDKRTWETFIVVSNYDFTLTAAQS